jgi:hypothetical protein
MCMYEYYPFTPHNGIIIATVFIYLSSPLMIALTFHGNIIYINCLILYFVYKSFCWFFLRTRANFIIGLWAVKLHVNKRTELNYHYHYGSGIAQSVQRRAMGWAFGVRFQTGTRNLCLLHNV